MRIELFLLGAVLCHGSAAQSVDAGKKLFAASCSVGYCHGAEGRAGRGPRLRDREWDRNYLLKVIDEGIPNSSMPAWRGKLASDQMSSIVAYILSISKEVAAGQTASTSPTASVSRPADSGPGKALFFDATNERNCGVCHKVGGDGGEVGPDLSSLTAQSPREILKRIVTPPASTNRKPVEIVMKDGEKVRGVLIEEKPTTLRIYDLTSPGPPVARTIGLPDIAERRPIAGEIAHENLAGSYTKQQLVDLVTYLKASKVALEDIF